MAEQTKEKDAKRTQEEEILGKAYDGRLMRRLLVYLRPFKLQVGISIVAILLKAAADIMGPFLTMLAVNKYMGGMSHGDASHEAMSHEAMSMDMHHHEEGDAMSSPVIPSNISPAKAEK